MNILISSRPYTNKFYKHRDKGSYVCKICSEKLFLSSTKYDSGSGWPLPRSLSRSAAGACQNEYVFRGYLSFYQPWKPSDLANVSK